MHIRCFLLFFNLELKMRDKAYDPWGKNPLKGREGQAND